MYFLFMLYVVYYTFYPQISILYIYFITFKPKCIYKTNRCCNFYIFGYILFAMHFTHKGSRVQGLFIRHIINYTGYNQKLKVNQVRSAQWTVQKN